MMYFAPGHLSRWFTSFSNSLMLYRVTRSGNVRIAASDFGTPTSSMSIVGSAVITDLPLKFTRLPIRFPRTRPALPFMRWRNVFRGRLFFWIACGTFLRSLSQ